MHEPPDVAPLHLDDDVLAGAQPRGVDLGDRRGGQRRALEALEHGLQRLAELGLDGAAHDVERLGRHLIAAALELLDELGREEALTRRDDLAELDERRAQRLGGQPQPAREVGRAGATPFALVQPRDDGAGEAGGHDHAAPPGREATRGDQVGHRHRGVTSQRLRRRPPGDRVAVEHPGRVVAERAPFEVGGSGHRHQHGGDDREFRARAVRSLVHPVDVRRVRPGDGAPVSRRPCLMVRSLEDSLAHCEDSFDAPGSHPRAVLPYVRGRDRAGARLR